MNREQSGAIVQLHRERAVKFDEIVSSLAMDLGYGDPAMLSQGHPGGRTAQSSHAATDPVEPIPLTR